MSKMEKFGAIDRYFNLFLPFEFCVGVGSDWDFLVEVLLFMDGVGFVFGVIRWWALA